MLLAHVQGTTSSKQPWLSQARPDFGRTAEMFVYGRVWRSKQVAVGHAKLRLREFRSSLCFVNDRSEQCSSGTTWTGPVTAGCNSDSDAAERDKR